MTKARRRRDGPDMEKAATGVGGGLVKAISRSSPSLWRNPQTRTQQQTRLPFRAQFSYLACHIVSFFATGFNGRERYPR